MTYLILLVILPVTLTGFVPTKQLRKSFRHFQDTTDDFDTINDRVRVDGMPLFQGDMVMTEDMITNILDDTSLSPRLNKKLHRMWIRSSKLRPKKDKTSDTKNTRGKRAALKSEYRLWGDGNPVEITIGKTIAQAYGVIPYIFDDDLPSWKRALILQAIQHWETNTADNTTTDMYCIKFVPWDGKSDNYIRFIDSEGCWSSVGRSPSKGPQKVSIGPRCASMGLIAHELGHAIGFFHEQSRPDRDKWIRVISSNVRNSRRFNFIKYNQYLIDTRDVDYDYRSIMHYRLDAFTKNGADTLKALKPLEKSVKIGQREAASEKDIIQVRKMYQCDVDATEEPTVTEGPADLISLDSSENSKSKQDLYKGHWTWDHKQSKWVWHDAP